MNLCIKTRWIIRVEDEQSIDGARIYKMSFRLFTITYLVQNYPLASPNSASDISHEQVSELNALAFPNGHLRPREYLYSETRHQWRLGVLTPFSILL